MRFFPSSLPFFLLSFVFPAVAEEAAPASPPAPAGTPQAEGAIASASRVDTALRELGAEAAPATSMADSPMPEAPEGQSVAVSDGGLFFDAANSQLVYLNNVRLCEARVRLRAANRLYIQLPNEGRRVADEVQESVSATAEAAVPVPQTQQVCEGSASAQGASASPVLPLEAVVYDALVDSVANRLVFTSGPGVPRLSFRQGNNLIELTEAEGTPARALADEVGNILLEAALIHLRWEAEDGSLSEFRTTGGRVLYHAASHALVMEGPVEASYHNGESTMQCSGPFCVTLLPEEGAASHKSSGFMGQFTSMRFSGVAAASATGNVQFYSRMSGEGMSLSGDALHYNGKTGRVEVPGSPCILTYGEGGRNSLQTDGSLVLEENGDIHFNGKGHIEGVYVRPAREEGAPALRGTLSAQAPLSFHAENGTITTKALNARDAEASLSCTGEVCVSLVPRTAEELAAAPLPPREKVGMLNMALARYNGIGSLKLAGQVRAQLLDPAVPSAPEASLTASQLDADFSTGEVRLMGVGEDASIAFRGYSLSGTAAPLTPASVHLKRNGDIETRGAQVTCTVPGDKGITTLTCTDRMLLAREPRSLSLGSGTRIQSPEGIVTTNGPLQAVLAPGSKPAKPLSPRFPQLSYDFSGLDSAETFEGATIRTAQGSMQCTQHLSILMLPPGSAEKSSVGGIRSAIATGQVLIAAKDGSGRVMRASGSRLEVDGISGEKKLTGSRVVLEDARNRHEASGEGAAVRIDARNNARITGARHSTSATGIREQVEKNDTKILNKDNKPN